MEAIRQEITREVEQFLRVVFQDQRNTGRIDLEATEMAMRSALHRAGAAALSQLLQAYGFLVAERSRFSPSAHAGRLELRAPQFPPEFKPRGSPDARRTS